MRKIILFAINVYKKANENELISMANALTYKLVASLFPFIIFLMTLLGFFNIPTGFITSKIYINMPSEIVNIINVFLDEVFYTKNFTLLSSSLAASIINSSSGFRSIIRGLNRAYGQKENRGFVKVRIISFILVFVFASIIILSLLIFIFKDVIKNLLIKLSILGYIPYIIDNVLLYIINAFVLFVMVITIYRIAICKKVKFAHLYPGALFTSILWLIVSKFFNLYINNFSRFSRVYGSIGSIFILLFWVNMISFIFLLGGQINAVIFDNK